MLVKITACFVVLVVPFLGLDLTADPGDQEVPVGYADTPQLPGSKWRVHDGRRPQPRVVTPGSAGREGSLPAPSDAILLFDGKDLSRFERARGAAAWKVADGYMEVNGSGSIQTKESFGDCQLHIEWATPETVKGRSQGRGNSGVYMMRRYEIQLLDSFMNRTYPDGQAAALYGQTPPLVNACRGPGEWQTFDIIFKAPRFEGETLVSMAYVTVIHNGVVVHHHQPFLGPTVHKKLSSYSKHASKEPIRLQDHGNPVRYRNIWVRPLAGYDQ